MSKICQTCHSFKDCIGHNSYSYSDIRFCPYQVIWILENASFLEEGYWVDSDKDWIPTTTSSSSHIAPFVKAVEVLAEVRIRLDKTGNDGKTLLSEILRKEFYFSSQSHHALMYIKGWRRKRTDYSEWLKRKV